MIATSLAVTVGSSDPRPCAIRAAAVVCAASIRRAGSVPPDARVERRRPEQGRTARAAGRAAGGMAGSGHPPILAPRTRRAPVRLRERRPPREASGPPAKRFLRRLRGVGDIPDTHRTRPIPIGYSIDTSWHRFATTRRAQPKHAVPRLSPQPTGTTTFPLHRRPFRVQGELHDQTPAASRAAVHGGHRRRVVAGRLRQQDRRRAPPPAARRHRRHLGRHRQGRPAQLALRHDGDQRGHRPRRRCSWRSRRSTPPAACSARRSSRSARTAPPTGRPSPRRRRS